MNQITSYLSPYCLVSLHNNNSLHINTVTLIQLIERIMLFKINRFKQNYLTFFGYLDKTAIVLVIRVMLQSQGVLSALKKKYGHLIFIVA